MKRVIFGLLWIGTVLGFGSATAAGLPVPKVEYAADREVRSAQGNFSAKVYQAGNKERTEMSMGGMQTVTIMRRDRNVMWTLMPAQRMYREASLKSLPAEGTVPEDVEISAVGEERVEGVNATKYKMLLKDRSGGGFVWLTPDNIPVKMDMLTRGRDGSKNRMTMVLKNIRTGRQDPALFEVPAGYSKMPAVGGFSMNLFR